MNDAICQAHVQTPLGPMMMARNAQGLCGLWFDDQRHHPGTLDVPVREDDEVFNRTRAALADYFQGGGLPRDLPMAPRGTEFQMAVWQALRSIPDGGHCSYGQIASYLGRPNAQRAVGAAVGRNPISILIPCHRVLGKTLSLTGYDGGLHRKRMLLQLEGVPYVDTP